MIPCEQSEKIAVMAENVADLKDEVFGNGKEGLKTTVPILSENVKQQTLATKDLKTAISGLTKVKDETTGEIKEKERSRVNTRWVIGVLSGVAVAAIGWILTMKIGG